MELLFIDAQNNAEERSNGSIADQIMRFEKMHATTTEALLLIYVYFINKSLVIHSDIP